MNVSGTSKGMQASMVVLRLHVALSNIKRSFAALSWTSTNPFRCCSQVSRLSTSPIATIWRLKCRLPPHCLPETAHWQWPAVQPQSDLEPLNWTNAMGGLGSRLGGGAPIRQEKHPRRRLLVCACRDGHRSSRCRQCERGRDRKAGICPPDH